MRYKETAVKKKLKEHIKDKYGSYAKAAEAWGLGSRQRVYQLIINPQSIPGNILRKIGLKRVQETYYEEVRKRNGN